jgi:hypothetical protein
MGGIPGGVGSESVEVYVGVGEGVDAYWCKRLQYSFASKTSSALVQRSKQSEAEQQIEPKSGPIEPVVVSDSRLALPSSRLSLPHFWNTFCASTSFLHFG